LACKLHWREYRHTINAQALGQAQDVAVFAHQHGPVRHGQIDKLLVVAVAALGCHDAGLFHQPDAAVVTPQNVGRAQTLCILPVQQVRVQQHTNQFVAGGTAAH
jgi:hypothetical protein